MQNVTSGLLYQTVLVYVVHDSHFHFIVREIRFRLNINCTVSFPNGPLPVNPILVLPAYADVPVMLDFFSGSSFSQNKTLDKFHVGEKVFVRAYTNITDGNIKMMLTDCYTLPLTTLDPKLLYFIIRNGYLFFIRS